MRKVERYRNNIMINDILVHKEKMTKKDERGSSWENNWVKVEPKYYIDKLDDMIYEIWYDRTGIILDGGLNTYIKNDKIATDWTIANLKEINKESAMIKYRERLLREERLAELDAKEKQELISYNNKDLMSRVEDGLEKENEEPRFDITKAIKESKGNICCEIEAPIVKQNNNGGATDYYTLPKDANTLQDLIEHRNMNGSVKDIFKACYRLGIKTEDELRDLNKMAYYALREIGRVTGRKDYITIAKELIGSQAIEKE